MKKTIILIAMFFISAASFADDKLRVISIDGTSAFPIEKCHRIHYDAQSDRIEIQLTDTIFSYRANESTLLDFQDRNYTVIKPDSVPYNQIWYRTEHGELYMIQNEIQYNNASLNTNIVSNTYENGLGVIVCESAIETITNMFRVWDDNITEIYFPNSVQTLEDVGGVFGYTKLKTFGVPKNLKTMSGWGIQGPNTVSFSGYHVSDDGKCIIIDSVLCAFAPKGVKNYVIPTGVHTISSMSFRNSPELESLRISEGVRELGGDVFYCSNNNLKEVYLPNSLEYLHPYAFHTCSKLEYIYGNSEFTTDDNLCVVSKRNAYDKTPTPPWIIFFAGATLTEYVIPEGIVGIENYAFSNKKLKNITLPYSLERVGYKAFDNCEHLEALYGPHTSEDHKCVVFNNQLSVFAVRTNMPKKYVIPDNYISIGDGAFEGCQSLNEIVMGDNITQIGRYAFASCPNLKSITLSARLRDISGFNAFLHSDSLESIYLRAPIPPAYSDDQMSEYKNLSIYVPKESYELYLSSNDWVLWRDYFKPYDYGDLSEFKPEYFSSDFSKNMLIDTFQMATIGDGIDIILMGDAYSDRQIADSSYYKDMKYLYDNLFTEEPYNSFKEMFNVYAINVISFTEGYGNGSTALGGFFGGGTYVGGNDAAAIEYALQVVPYEKLDNAIVIVAMNSNKYAGTCYMYDPTYNNNDYGTGLSISYFPKGGDAATFAQLLHHEALGHGFAKLADEYAYEEYGAVPESTVDLHQHQQTNWGWWKNVDFTNDSTTIRWSRLLLDERYQYDGLGAFEGGLTYWTGVWRPTENSIMRYNTGGFNAPSREAIYYRIHKLAYGDDWEYDYEKFVEWDAKNRKTQSDALRMPTRKEIQNFVPLHPPVIKQMSWQDAIRQKEQQTQERMIMRQDKGKQVNLSTKKASMKE